MKSKKVVQQLDDIRAVMENLGGEVYLEDIHEALSMAMSLRTLQRKLEELIERGVVLKLGRARSTKYRLYEKGVATSILSEPGSNSLYLSAESKEIISIIMRPESERKPVGYQRLFLESYQPNVSSYLTSQEKKKLAETGKTPDLNQPAGTYAREILNRLLIDLSWNSSRLEGNTYSLLDTERLISLGETADNKSAAEAQMILNHKAAIEFLVEDIENIGFNRYTILNLHAILSDNLLPNPAASGRLRSIIVGIRKSVYTPPGIPQLIEEMFEMILEKVNAIEDPFEQAFFIMVHLPYLQPFDDVNKRVSRLSANISLNRHNLAPLSFIDVPNDIYIQGLLGIYELNKIGVLKDVFLWAYERSSARYASVQQSLGQPDAFRLKYRNDIRGLITEIVSYSLTHKEASLLISKRAEQLLQSDRSKFIESVETELMSLHEGNFARYMIGPSAFKRWKGQWVKK